MPPHSTLLRTGLVRTGLVRTGLVRTGLVRTGLVRTGLVRSGLALAVGLSLALSGAASFAADFGVADVPPPVVEGIDCAAVPALPWDSVWLGHFSGGDSAYDRDAGQIALNWVDQKLCFPSRRACDGWIKPLRRAYHRPESYWTCLRLR